MLHGRRCVVVGDGAEAARRLDELVRAGAIVTVVSSSPEPTLRASLAATPLVRHHARAWRDTDAVGATIVHVATGDPRADERVARDVRRHGGLVHVVDRPELCDVYLPAVHRQGPVVVSVSSSGTSPALASWLRTRLASHVGPEFARAATLLAAARAALRAERGTSEGLAWRGLLDDGLLDELRDDDDAAARRLAAFVRATR